jgi:hypothetical protein
MATKSPKEGHTGLPRADQGWADRGRLGNPRSDGLCAMAVAQLNSLLKEAARPPGSGQKACMNRSIRAGWSR